ncbi:FG-GAP-like repeat-containing protein [Streptomycetaceae bacterium NBC_01309]
MSLSAKRFQWPGSWPRKRAGAIVAAVVAAALGAGTLTVLVDGDGDGGDHRGDGGASVAGPPPVDESEAQRQARVSNQPVRVETSLTATSTTMANPDGTFTWTQHVLPIRVKAPDGRWSDVDTTLEPVAGGFAPRATTTKLVFGEGGSEAAPAGTPARNAPRRPTDGGAVRAADVPSPGTTDPSAPLPPGGLLRMTTPEGKSFTMLWPHGKLPKAQVTGDAALYAEVFPGVDLVLTARDGGFSQVLVVKDRKAAENPQLAEVAYQLASAEATFAVDPATGMVRATDASGNEVAAAPTPFMWDSSGHTPTSKWAELKAGQAPTPSTGPATTGTLALPGLGGPEPGTRDALVGARMDGDKLRLTPDKALLAGAETTYPVFIDPSFWSKQAGWTLAYKKYPTTPFWMGANFNGGTTTARIGYESDTGGTAQSFFRMSFDPNYLAGAAFKSSTFRILETHSWSCQARAVDLHLTGPIGTGTTWSNKPAPGVLQQSISAAKGYSASCPGDYLAFNTLNASTTARDGRWTDITFVLKAANENDAYSWKKFAVNPSMEIVYNRPPWASGGIWTSPGGACRTDANNMIADNDVTIHAHSSDPDGDLRDVFLRVWDETTGERIYDGYAPLQGDGWFHYFIPHTRLRNGSTYAYTMDPHDWSDAWAGPTGVPGAINNPCRFKVDKSSPNAPSVTSPQYKSGNDAAWPEGAEYGTLGEFTFGANGTADTVEYAYGFDRNDYFERVKAPSPGTNAVVRATPNHAGPVNLYVKAIDAVGNWSGETVYNFFVEPRDQVDGPMDMTGDQKPDLVTVTSAGDLKVLPSYAGGRLNPPDRANGSINGTRTDDGTGATGQDQVPPGYFANALVTYHGDFWGADGFQDLIARMTDGKLWVYPGNGRGAIDTAARIELLVPASSPAPSAFTQILSLGDATGDGLPDMLAVVGADLWALSGYTGASMLTATKIGTGGWDNYTIHTAGDISGDGAYDILLREKADNGEVFLRLGTKQGNGTNLASLGSGARTVYGAGGWQQTYYPFMQAIPDVTGDGIPDLWAVTATGTRHLWSGGRTNFANRTDLDGNSSDFCQTFPGANGGTKNLCGPILTKYLDLRTQGVPVGLPDTDSLAAPDGTGRFAHFRTPGATYTDASVYWHPNTGAHWVQGGIRGRWEALGWETSNLGYPTSDEFPVAGGARSDFRNGYIRWTASTEISAEHTYAGGETPTAHITVTGDFNGDGRTDLATVNDHQNGAAGLWTSLTTDSGGSSAPFESWKVTAGNWWITNAKWVAGDFDNDGRDDIAALYNYGNGRVKLHTFIARADGGFNNSVESWEQASSWDWARTTLMAGNANGTGADELVAIQGTADGRYATYTFTATPSGTFSAPVKSYEVPVAGWWYTERSHFALGDSNGDGRADVIGTYVYTDGTLKTFTALANANGTYPAAAFVGYTSAAGSWVHSAMQVTAGDSNGDGRADLIVEYDYGNSDMGLWTYTANAAGSLNTPVISTRSGAGKWNAQKSVPHAGDTNADGRADVIMLYDYEDSRFASWIIAAKPGDANGGFNQGTKTWEAPVGTW